MQQVHDPKRTAPGVHFLGEAGDVLVGSTGKLGKIHNKG